MRAWLLGITYTSDKLGGMIFSGHVVGARVWSVRTTWLLYIHGLGGESSSSEKSCCYGQSGKC